MALKKHTFKDGEIAIYDDALISKRGDYWQMRMWLQKEQRYARFSLKTRSESTAIDKAKQHYHEIKAMELAGRTYFSKTTKDGVDEYLKQRYKDYEAGLIVIGRYRTIATHLQHWLKFIGKDVKLKELERTDCENYYHERTKTKKGLQISQTTVENEQSTINAMMTWLHKSKEAYINGFDFKKLPRVDTGDEANRRNTFFDYEIAKIIVTLNEYIAEAQKNLDEDGNLVKAMTGYYLGVSIMSGLRRGEQLQLLWGDVEDMEHSLAKKNRYDLIKLTIRGITSKVRKTRKFVVKDSEEYFFKLLQLTRKIHNIKENHLAARKMLADKLVFSINGTSAITPRAIGYHFDKIIELAKIDVDGRDLVPYSFRHYFITQRVNSNLPPAAVAEMCGTSITQIEKTYYHTSLEKMVSNAIADYEYRDGLLVPK